MKSPEILNRIKGSLAAGAAGDALGYPVEFLYSFNEIKANYGPDGITGYDTTPDLAQISDDTQMTLYTAEAIIEAEKNGLPLMPTVCQAYLIWYGHQTGMPIRLSYKSLIGEIEELNQRRAPGNTCLSALNAINCGHDPVNDSKGCGGIMRVAPFGLYDAVHDLPLTETAANAGDSALITHLHPLSTYSSAAMAVIVRLCVTTPEIDTATFRSIVDTAVDTITEVYGANAPFMPEFIATVKNALDLADDDRSDYEVIENSLGGGWVAEETLAIALFSVMRHITDVKACLVCSVNHGGDSDSTGAVAGNIIGAIAGYDAIPAHLTDRLQSLDVITLISRQLYE